VLKLLKKELPATMVCKAVFVAPPVEYLVKGFILKTTMERNLVFLWRVVTPLYQPMGNLDLSYSERVGGDKVFIDPHAYGDAAKNIARIIAEGKHFDYLRTIETPEDFLRRHAPLRGDLPIVPDVIWLAWPHFMRGLTRYLVGEEDYALEQLRIMDRAIDQSGKDRWFFRPYLKQFLEAAERGSECAHRLLRHWVEENVEKFGLNEARACGAKRV
jgi:hypothetical protein